MVDLFNKAFFDQFFNQIQRRGRLWFVEGLLTENTIREMFVMCLSENEGPLSSLSGLSNTIKVESSYPEERRKPRSHQYRYQIDLWLKGYPHEGSNTCVEFKYPHARNNSFPVQHAARIFLDLYRLGRIVMHRPEARCVFVLVRSTKFSDMMSEALLKAEDSSARFLHSPLQELFAFKPDEAACGAPRESIVEALT